MELTDYPLKLIYRNTLLCRIVFNHFTPVGDKLIEANILLRAHELEKAAFTANRIAARISAHIKNVDRVLIHYEPIRTESIVYALPLCRA